jgi:hypothetical protein
MKKYILIITLFVGCHVFAQQKLNAYKYVVIPSQFQFQKEPNQYGLNMLLKYKFEQLGFETYIDSEEIPMELKTNMCSYITPKLKHASTLFSTKISVELLNCNNEVVFVTQEGKSKSKSYKGSNNEALRGALKSFNGYHLKYTPNTVEEATVDLKEDPIVTLPEKSMSADFLYQGEQVVFVKTNKLYVAELKNVTTSKLFGQISKTSKKGIYHVRLNSKLGIGYYDETGNFIVEILQDNGNVVLHRFQVLD